MTDRGRQRTAIVLFGVLVVALVVLASMVGAVWSFLACDGDGGYPYAARDSTTGRVCEVYDQHEVLWLVQLALPGLATLLLLAVAARRASWSVASVGLAASLALALVPAAVINNLPDSCTPADQKAFDAWARKGGRGPMPADCETY